MICSLPAGFEGVPPAEFRWTGPPALSDDLDGEDGTLDLYSLTADHLGVYMCTPFNGPDSAYEGGSATVRLNERG